MLGRINRTIKYTTYGGVIKRNMSFDPSLLLGIGAVPLAVGAYIGMYWKTVLPHQRIVVTGLGIGDAYIGQTKLLLPKPLHQWYTVDLGVHTINFDVTTYTKDKISLKLPIVLTSCPDTSTSETDGNRFLVYLEKYGGKDKEEIKKILENDVGTEIRSSAGNMNAEDIARNKDEFKTIVTTYVKKCLYKSGVSVVNLGVSELLDGGKSTFFAKLGERAEQSANRDALVATSEHENKTEMEQAKFTSEKRREVANKNADAILVENENKQKESQSRRELDVFNAEQDKQARLAKLQAGFEADMKEIEFKKLVEESRRSQIIESQKSEHLSPAIVAKDKLIVDTDAEAYKIKTIADANLYKQEQEARGNLVLLEAQATGIKLQVDALGGDSSKFISHILAKNGEYSTIAKELSNGLRGTNPIIFAKGGADGTTNMSDTIADITGVGMAFAQKYKESTGIDLLGNLLKKSQSP
jgi:uncharacterized membrane protein YqiK